MKGENVGVDKTRATIGEVIHSSEPATIEFTCKVALTGCPELRVREFNVKECIAAAYVADVTVDVDFGFAMPNLIGHTATLTWCGTAIGSEVSRFSGVVTSVATALGTATARRRSCELRIEPAFFCLREEICTRSFSDVTVLDLVRQVLAPAVGAFDGREIEIRVPLADDTHRGLVKRPFCVQYHESTLAFFQRLFAEEGLTYYFDHSAKNERLILTDGLEFERVVKPLPVGPFSKNGPLGIVNELTKQEQRSAKKVSLSPFDPLHPEIAWDEAGRGVRLPLASKANRDEVGDGHGEALVHLPGDSAVVGQDAKSGLRSLTDIERRAEVYAERLATECTIFTGAGTVTTLRPGTLVKFDTSTFLIADWARSELLIESVEHRGHAPGAESGAERRPGSYDMNFTCRRGTQAFRPTPRPKPTALEDWALIIAGDTIETDQFGRVHVRFLFDHEGGKASRAWVPVSQAWVGSGYGTQILPRAGMLARIEYQFGNPDRPIIADCFPSRRNALPSSIPATRASRLVIRTSSLRDSTKAAEHHNEIALDDAQDREEVLLHAGWDFLRRVGNDEGTKISRDEHRKVGNDQIMEVLGTQTLEVSGGTSQFVQQARKTNIEGDAFLSVVANDTEGGKSSEMIRGDAETAAAMARTITVNGGEAMSLRGGRTSLVDHGSDGLHVTGLRHVHADGEVRIRQEKTTVLLSKGEGHFDVDRQIEATTDGVSLTLERDEPTRLLAKKLRLVCGGSTITFEEGTIKIKSPHVHLRGASGSVDLAADGAVTTGCDVVASAVVLNELKGPLVVIKAGGAPPSPGFASQHVGPGERSGQRADVDDNNSRPTVLNAALWGRDGRPVGTAVYRMRLPDGRILSGTTDQTGAFHQPLPAGITSVEVSYKPTEDDDEVIVTVGIPDLDSSPEDTARVQLRNLGYFDPSGSESNAIRSFQRDSALPLTGAFDDGTRARLAEFQAALQNGKR